MSHGSRERRMRRLRNGQLYSAGLTRVGIEARLRRPLGPPSSGASKDGSSGTLPTDRPLGFAITAGFGSLLITGVWLLIPFQE